MARSDVKEDPKIDYYYTSKEVLEVLEKGS
jgi:hypothetical protein